MADLAAAGPLDAIVPGPAAADLPPLKIRQKALFATGDLVDGGINVSIGTFLLFYLTAVCGLTGTQAGLALSITLLVDSVLDPFIGYTSDNTHSRHGRRHPFLFGSIVPLALSIGLLFSLPAALQGWALFGYLLVVLLLERVGHSAFLLPYAALGAEISRDYRERSSLGAYRSLFNIAANLTVVYLGFGVFMHGETGLLNRPAYASFGWSIAALILVAGLICAIGTLRMRNRMHQTVATQRFSLARFTAEIGEVARNKSFRVLFLTVLVFWVAQGTAAVLTLHALKFFWKLPADVIQLVPIFSVIGLATGIGVSAFLLQRFEKQTVCVWALGLFCIAQFAPASLFILGWFPQSGPPLFIAVYALQIVIGWMATAAGITFGAMMADSADEHELLYGSRREALYFAGLIFSAKAAIAVGSLIGGVGLDVIGFPHDIAAQGAALRIPPDAVRDLGLVAGPGAAAIAFISVIILMGYNLNAKRHAEIVEELTIRRAAKA